MPLEGTRNDEMRVKAHEAIVDLCLQIGNGGKAGSEEGSSNVHWRYKLIASTCLAVQIRPEVAAPPALWHWFLDCVESDAVPLRSLALVCLGKLLSLHRQRKRAVEATVSERVRSRKFQDSLFKALVFNHRQAYHSADGRAGGSGQWSIGVMDAMQEVLLSVVLSMCIEHQLTTRAVHSSSWQRQRLPSRALQTARRHSAPSTPSW